MIRLISLLFVTILLTSCKESRVDKITRLVNEWSGKAIRFPDNMCLTSYANDTVIMKYEREKLPYTILNYVDTIGCMSCKLQLPRWKEMLEEIDSVYPNKVNCLMVFYPKGKRKFIKQWIIASAASLVLILSCFQIVRMENQEVLLNKQVYQLASQVDVLEKENLENEKVFILKGKYFEEINKINESFHYFNRSLEINPISSFKDSWYFLIASGSLFLISSGHSCHETNLK